MTSWVLIALLLYISIIIKKEPRGWVCGKFNTFLCCLWTLTISSVLLVPWFVSRWRPFDPLVSWTSVPDAPQTQVIKTDLVNPPEQLLMNSPFWGVPHHLFSSPGPSPSWRPAQAEIKTHGVPWKDPPLCSLFLTPTTTASLPQIAAMALPLSRPVSHLDL